jgi:DNA polymerase-3 subunit epsilon
MPASAVAARVGQASFDELGTPLRDVTFVVVDLETTGGSTATSAITEVGAVKVRGGEVLGEFQTLVDPGGPVPAFITVLTGITDAMLVGAPPLGAVIPAFLEFLGDAVVVAHNAPFDVGFLREACQRTGHAWPATTVVDTVRLARSVLGRHETPNHRLATLAAHFHARTSPAHRALDDARATVDVLHGLLERLGTVGVGSLEELVGYTGQVSPQVRAKRHLADTLPHAPGVYVFEDAQGRPLYVGTSVDLHTRVRSYFTASQPRARIRDMVTIAERVRPIVCETTVEAQVRELRLIAAYQPPFNRRSRRPHRAVWLKLTVEPFPRLSVVRTVSDDRAAGAAYVGPFPSAQSAADARDGLLDVFALRACTTRLSARGGGQACARAGMGRCGAPCVGGQSVSDYADVAGQVRDAMRYDVRPVVSAARGRLAQLVAQERFEQAAVVRDRLVAFVGAAARAQRLAGLAGCPELVAARPQSGGWELLLVRGGRFAGACPVPRGAPPGPYVEALRAADPLDAAGRDDPAHAARVEETECLLRWLEAPGVRLVDIEGAWCSPAYGAGHALRALVPASGSRVAAAGTAG